MTKKPFEIGLVIQLRLIDCDQNKACEAKNYTPIAYRNLVIKNSFSWYDTKSTLNEV